MSSLSKYQTCRQFFFTINYQTLSKYQIKSLEFNLMIFTFMFYEQITPFLLKITQIVFLISEFIFLFLLFLNFTFKNFEEDSTKIKYVTVHTGPELIFFPLIKQKSF